METECLHKIFEKVISDNSTNQNKIFIFSCESWAEEFQNSKLQICTCKIRKFRIIVFQYIRPQIDLLTSAYLQWTIWSENPTLEDCVRTLKRISDWESQVDNVLKSGADEVVVRYTDDIVQDFCDALSIEMISDKKHKIKRVNKSLPVEALTILLRNRELRKGVHDSSYDILIEYVSRSK